MQRKSFEGMNCSIARALEEVGEWWSLMIVRECTQGSTRFEEFQKELGIARNILTVRLEKLTRLGILERFALEERANAEGYRLTEKGEELYPVLVALMQWGDKWLYCGGKPSVELVEDATGEAIQPITVQSKGGRPLSYREVRFSSAAGATEKTDRVIKRRNGLVLKTAELSTPQRKTRHRE